MRPIDADALADDFLHDSKDAGFYRAIYEGAARRVKAAPTLDFAPVRHGEWRQHKLSVPKGRGQTYSVYGCSLCHKHERKRSDYCPNCGAKMDGGKDDV